MIVFLSIDSAKMKRKQTILLHSWQRESVKVRPFMSINALGEKIVCVCAHVVVLLTIDYMHT